MFGCYALTTLGHNIDSVTASFGQSSITLSVLQDF